MKILVARTPEEINKAYEILAQAKVLGCDTETSALSAQNGKLFSVQLSDGNFSCLIPLSEGISLGKIEKILAHPQIVKVFHNAKFDLSFLRANGFAVENIFCTMIAEKILTKGADQSVSLSETLYRYFGINLDKSLRATFTRSWNGMWTDELVNYALADVIYLPQLMAEQKIWLEKLNLMTDFENELQKILQTVENQDFLFRRK